MARFITMHSHSLGGDAGAALSDTSFYAIYRVAHKKRPQLCNHVVLLTNRIQTKTSNFLKSNIS